ncbi:MAG: hypothetical protein ACREK3_03405, partial [Gemmatimonadota bacterium]
MDRTLLLVLAAVVSAVQSDPVQSAIPIRSYVGPAGAYIFLGDLVGVEATERGVLLRCEPEAGLQISFLDPGTVRVTLDRPDREEVPLEAPLVELDPQPIDIEIVEEPDRILLRSAELDVAVDRSPCGITFLDREGNVLSQDEPGLGIGWDGDEVRNWKTIEEGERFFGLGEKTGNVDKRGREWVMWTSDTYGYGNETDPLYE